MTTLIHGAAATQLVQAASEALFGRGDVGVLDAQTLADATAELPGASVPVGVSLVDALVAVGLSDSRNSARRTLREGAVSLNGEKVGDPDAVLSAESFLHGRVAILRRGRKALAAARAAT